MTARRLRSRIGSPARRTNCLGISAPKRSPLPPARRMAWTRMRSTPPPASGGHDDRARTRIIASRREGRIVAPGDGAAPSRADDRPAAAGPHRRSSGSGSPSAVAGPVRRQVLLATAAHRGPVGQPGDAPRRAAVDQAPDVPIVTLVRPRRRGRLASRLARPALGDPGRPPAGHQPAGPSSTTTSSRCTSSSRRAGHDVIQAWHACGAFKRFGYSVVDKTFGADASLLRRVRIHRNYDVCLVSSMAIAPHYAEAFDQPLERVPLGPGHPAHRRAVRARAHRARRRRPSAIATPCRPTSASCSSPRRSGATSVGRGPGRRPARLARAAGRPGRRRPRPARPAPPVRARRRWSSTASSTAS